jgi:hypothetical protein
MLFAVARSGDMTSTLQAHYTTVNGTAHAGTDYVATSGTLTFPPGASTETIAVPVIGHAVAQGKRSFTLQMSDPASAVTFGPPQDFATGGDPIALAVGDINGDGKPDLVIANSADNTVSVLLNTTPTGATVPSFASQVTFAAGPDPVCVALGDLNGDGLLDIVVADALAPESGDITVLLNTTPPGAAVPSFAPAQTLAAPDSPGIVKVGDINGDGNPDIVVADEGGLQGSPTTVSVLVNMTAPGASTLAFAPQQTFATGPDSMLADMALADLSGDGKLDIVVSDEAAEAVSVLMNQTPQGSATVSFAAPQVFGVGAAPESLAVGDLNGDGLSDILVGNLNSTEVSVLLNQTAPGYSTAAFAPQQTIDTGAWPESVALADVNQDGIPDLFVANRFFDNSGNVGMLLNQTTPGAGSTTLAPPQTIATDSGSVYVTSREPFPLAMAEVNGDGSTDIVILNENTNSVSVLLNTTSVALEPGAAVGTIVAQSPLAITSPGSATFTVGQAGRFTVTTTTGLPAATALSVSGRLPAGVTFRDNHDGTASLVGTPSAGTGGRYTLTLSARNAVAVPAARTFTLLVDQAPAFTSAAVATFLVGRSSMFTITTRGAPAGTITAAGALPRGVTLVEKGNGTAVLSGKPTARGSFHFSLIVRKVGGPAAVQPFDLIVA